LAECGFVAIHDLEHLRESFETWSRICLEGFLLPAGTRTA
jgi:hypothetical protein